MVERSLTGAWSGAYQYAGNVWPETVFNAVIDERDGRFTGSTTEPNVVHPWLGGVVTADIDGMRHDQDVNFTKFMDGSGGMHHAIHYDGRADPDLTRVNGTWRIPGDGSGTFFMTRDDPANDAAVIVEAEETVKR
jgi:hypothetical protein